LPRGPAEPQVQVGSQRRSEQGELGQDAQGHAPPSRRARPPRLGLCHAHAGTPPNRHVHAPMKARVMSPASTAAGTDPSRSDTNTPPNPSAVNNGNTDPSGIANASSGSASVT